MLADTLPEILLNLDPVRPDDYILTRDYWDHRAEVGDIPPEDSEPMPEGYEHTTPLPWSVIRKNAGDLDLFFMQTERFVLASSDIGSFLYTLEGKLEGQNWTDDHRAKMIEYVQMRERDNW